MIVAQQKRKENIAEYLLYMWQVEDMIRAYNLNMDAIRTHIVARYNLAAPQQEEVAEWYSQLIDMMRLEGVMEHGHLQINKNIVLELTDLHLQMLKSTRQPFYTAAFYKTLPYIVELRGKQGENKVGEIETCFNALYGVLLLKIQQKEISASTLAALKQISTLVAILAEKYREMKSDTLEL